MRDRTPRSSLAEPADAPTRARRLSPNPGATGGGRSKPHDEQLLTLQRVLGNAAVGRLISTSTKSPEVQRFYALSDDTNRNDHPQAPTGRWLGYDWIDLPDPRNGAVYPATVPGPFLFGTYWSAWPVRNLYARSTADADRAAGYGAQLDANGGGIDQAELFDAPHELLDDVEVIVDDAMSEDRSPEIDMDEVAELPRVLGQGSGGTTIGDLCNSLGVIGSLVTVAMGDEGSTATGSLGILGGLGVLSGGVSQIWTSATTEATVQGWSNVFSGTFGTISGVIALGGSTVLSDIFARFSLLTWSVAEFINFGTKVNEILAGTADNRDKVLAVCSLLKGIGGGLLAVLAWPALGEVFLMLGIVLTAAGVVGGVGAGLYKLGQICRGLDGENPNA